MSIVLPKAILAIYGFGILSANSANTQKVSGQNRAGNNCQELFNSSTFTGLEGPELEILAAGDD